MTNEADFVDDTINPNPPNNHLKSVVADIAAGTLAGINVTLVGHPFDTLKVRLQTQPQSSKVYTGLIDCFQKTIKWEGVTGLYKGVMSPILGQIFFRTALFLSHGESKRYFVRDGKDLQLYHYFLAGSIGWGMGTIVECPIDVIKSQLQVQIIKSKTVENYKAPFLGMKQCMTYIMQTNGVRGLYQGIIPHLCRNIPSGALHLGLFDIIRMKMAEKENIHVSQLKVYQSLIAGSIGGVSFWVFLYPFDVVKSSMQSDFIGNSPDRRYANMKDCIEKLYQEGGWRRFYRGFSPCLLRAVPANSIMLYTVAFVRERL
jgi:solute carrier family 25 carnitine/acylcarnitine transporter 20/29